MKPKLLHRTLALMLGAALAASVAAQTPPAAKAAAPAPQAKGPVQYFLQHFSAILVEIFNKR